jgi:hypothetical protein
MVGFEPSLNYVCQYYLDIADQILSQLEGIVPKEIPYRELFSLLSDLYLNPIGGGGQKKRIRKIYLGLRGFRINNLSTIRCKFDSFFLLFFLFIISFPYLSLAIYSSPSYYVGQKLMKLSLLNVKRVIIIPFVLLVVYPSCIKRSKTDSFW